MQFSDKVALVTGAGSGIGKATALRLAKGGARVAVLSRTDEEIQATRDEIIAAGGEAIAVGADISDPDGMRAAVDRIIADWGQIDIVVANAGIDGM